MAAHKLIPLGDKFYRVLDEDTEWESQELVLAKTVFDQEHPTAKDEDRNRWRRKRIERCKRWITDGADRQTARVTVCAEDEWREAVGEVGYEPDTLDKLLLRKRPEIEVVR